MASGMEMMLKSMGFSPEKLIPELQVKFGPLLDGVKKSFEAMEARLGALEKQCAEIREGQETSLKLLQELTAWKRQMVQLQLKEMSLQNPPPQPLIARPAPNPLPLDQPSLPMTLPEQPNEQPQAQAQ
jgi:hypothetical protein